MRRILLSFCLSLSGCHVLEQASVCQEIASQVAVTQKQLAPLKKAAQAHDKAEERLRKARDDLRDLERSLRDLKRAGKKGAPKKDEKAAAEKDEKAAADKAAAEKAAAEKAAAEADKRRAGLSKRRDEAKQRLHKLEAAADKSAPQASDARLAATALGQLIEALRKQELAPGELKQQVDAAQEALKVAKKSYDVLATALENKDPRAYRAALGQCRKALEEAQRSFANLQSSCRPH